MTSTSPLTPVLPSKLGDKHQWGQLHGSAMALAIYSAAGRANAPILVITPDTLTANALEDDLSFFAKGNDDIEVIPFPDWETLPYDQFSPHQDIISQRLTTLSRLPHLSKAIIITPISTLMQPLPPQTYLDARSFFIKRGDKLDIDRFRKRLEHSGYYCVNQVAEHGEFALRGSILDLYPMGSPLPYRLDLFDNEIDTIRTFDPDTQCSLEKVSDINLLPAREFPLTEDGITHFRNQWRSLFAGDPTKCMIYSDISHGISSPGIEYYLPLFFDETATLFDYLPENICIFRLGDVLGRANEFWDEIKQRHEQLAYDITRPLLEPTALFTSSDTLFQQMKRFARVQVQDVAFKEKTGNIRFATSTSPQLSVDNKAKEPLNAVKDYLTNTENRVLFCTESAGRREVLNELLRTIEIHPTSIDTWREFLESDTPVGITVGPLEEGLSLASPPVTIITESQLFAKHVMQRRKRKAKSHDPDAIVKDLTELHMDAPIVHIDHGVGRYRGLQLLHIGGLEGEYLTIEYEGGDKIYVPVAALHLISRYTGAEVENAPINKLGSAKWAKAKRKAAEKIRDVAAELLHIYAKRAARTGFAFPKPDAQYHSFASAFAFEETYDQAQAIEAVLTDMTEAKTMDRLICGDVGFGKTEVALRAAFLAVQGGKQVALLVPTTLLADQHYSTLQDRFADWPIRVEMLSRFKTKKEQEIIVAAAASGKVDIIIGTHKLIQGTITFKDLGLLIIDEEHRFGVQQKEKLKALRAQVDILTLTATPIPRTLNMAMSGMRDVSIIATPPPKRLSIKTFVQSRNDSLIREAILREILRGGQVYFLHNKVETIDRIAEEIQTLVPEARTGVGHGQLRERELEQVMADFYRHQFNVLVCTTIIETGIDVPTANTIIIDRADRFGLAQLHQLRGRVGRSHHQAYAYLMTPHEKAITRDAKKRLEAISALEDLGAGFTLATHDLEIRGAGELLGDEQSGHIEGIGFSLYMDMLERAVSALRAGEEPDLDFPLHQGAEIELKIPALIPDNYVHDVHTRLTLYKRIANAENNDALQELKVEIIDRFGKLPPATTSLFQVTQIKYQAEDLGIKKFEGGPHGGRITFTPTPKIDPATLINLIQSQNHIYQMAGPEKLKFQLKSETPKERFEVVEQVLKELRM